MEEEKLQDPKVEKPQVEGVGEEKETEKTTDELKEEHPEPETAERSGRREITGSKSRETTSRRYG